MDAFNLIAKSSCCIKQLLSGELVPSEGRMLQMQLKKNPSHYGVRSLFRCHKGLTVLGICKPPHLKSFAIVSYHIKSKINKTKINASENRKYIYKKKRI